MAIDDQIGAPAAWQLNDPAVLTARRQYVTAVVRQRLHGLRIRFLVPSRHRVSRVADRAVSTLALLEHPVEHGDLAIHVVVNPDFRLARVQAMEPISHSLGCASTRVTNALSCLSRLDNSFEE